MKVRIRPLQAWLAAALAAMLTPMSSIAQEPTLAEREVARLRAGEKFFGDGADLLGSDGRLDEPTLALFVAALRDTDDDPRAEVARALVTVARRADPLSARGGQAIRDVRVIDALVDPGLARRGGAKEVCLDALLLSVPPALLAPHGAALVASLRAAPDPTTALVIARVKPAGGLEALEAVARDNAVFGRSREVALARAALGDLDRERALIAAFRAEQDPAAKADQASDLGLVGTPAALVALGEAVRTPLVISSMSSRRSVRVAVLGALRRAFPEEPSLVWERIRDDSGYAAAEAFVEQRLGVTWTTPRPPFLVQENAIIPR